MEKLHSFYDDTIVLKKEVKRISFNLKNTCPEALKNKNDSRWKGKNCKVFLWWYSSANKRVYLKRL